jgi:hypothetical protein
MPTTTIKETGSKETTEIKSVYHLNYDDKEGSIKLVSLVSKNDNKLVYGLIASTNDGEKFVLLPCPPYCGKGNPSRIDIVNGDEVKLLSINAQDGGDFSLKELKSLGDSVCLCVLKLDGNDSFKFGFVKAEVSTKEYIDVESALADKNTISIDMDEELGAFVTSKISKIYTGPDDQIVLPQ